MLGTSARNSARDTEDLPLAPGFVPSDCPPLVVPLNLESDAEYETDQGILVKVLQGPAFEASGAPVFDVDPEAFDRSLYPAGACVVRLRGPLADCYDHRESYLMSTGEVVLSPPSFHELYACMVPGCPSASSNGASLGNWWYLTDRGTDTLFVGCGPLCGTFFDNQPTQLHLQPETAPSTCDE